MDRCRQNNVLRIVHELTRYFPAVRAVRILMDGKTLRPNECAAILQPFAEALRDLVPRDLIEHDQRRYLEGVRLLFSFILQQAESLSTKTNPPHRKNPEEETPYLDLFKTVDLRDFRTDEAIVDLVQTNFGLMERGCFAAFQPGGILAQLGMENVDIMPVSLDPAALRAVMRHGAISAESSFYDTDAIQAALSHNAIVKDPLDDLRVFSRDLPYLAKVCHKSGLTVVHPTSLKSASAPVLTLDRAGNLCVYVGRTACAAPDRDISIFRPSGGGTEEAVDVNIVAQLIEPIIRAREQDGTIIFELFSENVRFKNMKPTELLMFCVDCSKSMRKASDFREINETPIGPLDIEVTHADQPVTGEIDESISLDDVKEWLSSHESFEDMVAIVASVHPFRKRVVAEEGVDFVSLLTSRELLERCRQRAKLRIWATRTYVADTAPGFELQLGSLRRLLSGLNVYKAALVDLIILKALGWTEKEEFPWTFGRPIPDTRSSSWVIQSFDDTDHLKTPPEIVCPISHSVFEDPVITSDGFTYERLSIERWFQIRHSSPSTGLLLSDLSLRRNQPLYEQAKRWVSGEDILRAASPASGRFRLRSSLTATELTLNFVTPSGTFSRKVPSTLSLADLQHLVYRGMRGVNPVFSLHLYGSLLEPSDQQLGSRRISSGSDIVASMHPVAENASASAEDSSEKVCLVKVYKSSSELFSYWIARDTSHSMASIIFRYWRFKLSVPRLSFTKDQTVKSAVRYGGDGIQSGTRHDHWDLLVKALDLLSPRKLVPKEGLCSVSSMDEKDETVSQTSSRLNDDTSHIDAASVAPVGLYRVLKVDLSRYKDPEVREAKQREKLSRLTRMDVSKQVFGAFINRLIAYEFPTMVGLVSFGTSASLAQPLTAIIENFRHAVDTMKPSGDTSLWAALALAADQLVHLGQSYPGIPKRIVCLSDGVDTKSTASASDVCRRLVRDHIVVDSCSIGSEDNSQLRALSSLTGGYKFVPQTLEEAMAISELEPVLSIHERPPIGRPMIASLLTNGNFALAASQAAADETTRDNFPARKQHPNLEDQFVRIDALERVSRSVVTTSTNENSLSKPIVRHRRILAEIRHLASNPHSSYDVYVSESNMGFWKVVMSGPSESAYASGTFVLYLEMGDDYPQSPPQARFITRIFHPNINLGGRACHSIFSRNYTVDMTTKQMLDTVFGLLLVPEFTDPINTIVTLNFYWDEVAFREEVKSHIEKYASKGREELGREIVGE
jgi:ubiquitin-protein ligase